MKITNFMINKWAKAALLIFFGIILLIYWGQVLEELKPALNSMLKVQAVYLYDLVNALMWVIILWCFVDAAINIAVSFREQKVSLDELGAKLDAIGKKLGSQASEKKPAAPAKKPAVVQQSTIKKDEEESEEETEEDSEEETEEESEEEVEVEKSLSPPLPPPPPSN